VRPDLIMVDGNLQIGLSVPRTIRLPRRPLPDPPRFAEREPEGEWDPEPSCCRLPSPPFDEVNDEGGRSARRSPEARRSEELLRWRELRSRARPRA
jgi:hypothetical protein